MSPTTTSTRTPERTPVATRTPHDPAPAGTPACRPAITPDDPAPRPSVERRQTIPVFFTIDDAYAPYLGVALRSLIDNASRAYDYDIVILHEELSPAHRRKLEALAEPGFHLRFVRMADKIAGIENAHHNKLRQDYFTLTIFFRLFIPVMFPRYAKGIYLDSDIVVPGDISKLYETDLGGNLIGACRDLSVRGVPELVTYITEAVGVGIDDYVNSGVLLMDLDALRRVRLDGRFLELLGRYHFENLAPDQDYLNVLCHGRIAYLDPRWDAMPVVGQPELENPQLIHYNLFAKPWCYDDIPYGKTFWRYARTTAFYDEIRQHKLDYGPEQKASDTACIEQMARHGLEVAQADVTFRTVFESGAERRL